VDTNENQFLIIFDSYNQAMMLYNELTKTECELQLVSTPCGLSKGCSLAIIFGIEDTKKIIDAVKNNNIRAAGIYKIIKNHNLVNYVPVERA
jgi:hypothetical protein